MLPKARAPRISAEYCFFRDVSVASAPSRRFLGSLQRVKTEWPPFLPSPSSFHWKEQTAVWSVHYTGILGRDFNLGRSFSQLWSSSGDHLLRERVGLEMCPESLTALTSQCLRTLSLKTRNRNYLPMKRSVMTAVHFSALPSRHCSVPFSAATVVILRATLWGG